MTAAVLTALGAVLLAGAGQVSASPVQPASLRYRAYFVGSSDMAPTLVEGDRVMVDRKAPDPLRRGDLVVIKVRDKQWLKRIAAVPGDRIAIRQGQVILNGQIVAQSPDGEFELAGFLDQPPIRAPRLAEQFPGEARPHAILDLGKSQQDEFAEVILGPGQYFVLGDNRDNSIDSRMAQTPLQGLGLVGRDLILGRVAYRYWRRGEGARLVYF